MFVGRALPGNSCLWLTQSTPKTQRMFVFIILVFFLYFFPPYSAFDQRLECMFWMSVMWVLYTDHSVLMQTKTAEFPVLVPFPVLVRSLFPPSRFPAPLFPFFPLSDVRRLLFVRTGFASLSRLTHTSCFHLKRGSFQVMHSAIIKPPTRIPIDCCKDNLHTVLYIRG